jgi:ubiquinone/menaquinone biosynthesis C-methylase UbiE
MSNQPNPSFADLLWKIYRRPERPLLQGSDFPWNDPVFSERVLREHLDESHGAASRTSKERQLQINWLWDKLALFPEANLLDLTCGPGLYAVEFAARGCAVTGIDFSPASIAYAHKLAARRAVLSHCTFIEQDVREMSQPEASFDAAIFLYEQLAVFKKEDAQQALRKIAAALKPGGRLCVELLHQDWVDKNDSSWWFTDNKGLWGASPFLHLGERIWNEEDESSVERYHILYLETGEMAEFSIFDQTYAIEAMTELLREAGFSAVEVYESWDELPLYDANEWVVYVATK